MTKQVILRLFLVFMGVSTLLTFAGVFIPTFYIPGASLVVIFLYYIFPFASYYYVLHRTGLLGQSNAVLRHFIFVGTGIMLTTVTLATVMLCNFAFDRNRARHETSPNKSLQATAAAPASCD
jgi:hypothetical protein